MELYNIFYVDDGCFAFQSREDLELGTQLIFDTFADFGLIMHIGRDELKSKTEAMYFPKSLNAKVNTALTAPVKVADGQITHCDKFKYLGSLIEPTLKDHLEIRTRIRKAQKGN